MGDVWLSRDENLGTQVVIKLVAPEATADQIALLRQECRNARRLSHPNIVRVFDFHEDPGAIFISMEFVEGGNVADLRGREPREIINALLPLIEALEYAHGEGVIHRDLKSSNVLLDGSGRPRLTDFGIAGVLEPGSEDLLLAGGGSRTHASPQQLAGEPASPADDIYGLGALLLEVLGPAPSLAESWRSFLQSMVASVVEERPASMKAVRQTLEELLKLEVEEGTVAPEVVRQEIRLSPPPRVAEVRRSAPTPTPDPVPRERPAAARHPYWWMTITIFLVLAGVAAGVFVLLPQWVEERKSSPQTETGGSATPAAVSPEPSVAPVVEPSEIPPTLKESASAVAIQETADPVEVAVETPEKRASQVKPPPAAIPSPRVDRQAEQFRQAMSEGLRALDRGEHETAKSAFERALSLRPGSTEATDGLARSELALRLTAIRQHQTDAEAFENAERWQDAERAYGAALALDSTLRFAREGRNRAATRAALDRELEYHIAHPDRLAADKVLDEAQETLATARSIEPTTERLGRQIGQLQTAIKVATTPVEVLLVSDNATSVVVYKVGRLGTFGQQALSLRPGTYTVVGTREGYRDVRRQLRVVADGENKPLTIRCEEQI